ncbi:membrane protein insertase YidC [Candidatus Dependentiae bacterium]|nr:membrane protein insertase YidC [Candidatus Dependentiae bacterium]
MDKKLLLAIVLSVGTLFIYNYITKDKQKPREGVPQNIKSGQAYRAPSTKELNRPINTEIDFIDKKVKVNEQVKTFNTDYCEISFSNYGGVISSVEFKKHLGENSYPLKTILPKTFYEREQAAFLLALEEETPFFYDFINSKNFDDHTDVTYRAEAKNWIINKTYTIYKDSYKIDLKLKFNKKSDALAIRPRLFFPAPFIGEIENELQSGVVINLDGKSVKAVSARDLDLTWADPSIFGGQDKYFVHTLISDNANFVQRGFFRKVEDRLFPILEGPELNEESSFKLSFYVGPKLLEDLVAIDPRLEGLLDFGWLSWLCKILLKLLKYIYSLVGNYGLAIIIMTILLKIPFMPMTIKGNKKMKEYQKHMPALTRIRTKYKNDPQKLNAEIIRFHKERGLSPTAQLSGCLPYLIQMPILFALYRVLGNYLGLYQAPFFGWITDLSSKDPYYILPILMGVTMIIQQKMSPVNDSKTKAMMMFMPLVMMAIFINFPAGVVLYWLMNNVLLIGESYIGKKFLK